MDELIAGFPVQLKEAIEIGQSADINEHTSEIRNIILLGMGGSAIGGDIVASFIKEECKIPMLVNKSYDVPSFIDKHTLAIVSSYSGNTEETISAYKSILETGAKTVAISSGGKLIEMTSERSLDYILVPSGSPSPRACLGYSIVQQLFILHKLDLISDTCIDHIRSAADLINFDMDSVKELAMSTAKQVHDQTVLLYCTDKYEAIALRLKQQLNENAKMHCWFHTIPEMNHNELVAWKDENKNLSVIYFRNEDDFKRNMHRLEITKTIIAKYCGKSLEVHSKGKNFIERSIFLIHFGDWLSWYLSQLRGVDPIEIEVIDFLKMKLSELQ